MFLAGSCAYYLRGIFAKDAGYLYRLVLDGHVAIVRSEKECFHGEAHIHDDSV